MKKIKILLAVAFIGILSYGICSAHGGMSSNELLENVDAIANDEVGHPGHPCSDIGYKSWFKTTNIPTQREKTFYDCMCNLQRGYDPVAC